MARSRAPLTSAAWRVGSGASMSATRIFCPAAQRVAVDHAMVPPPLCHVRTGADRSGCCRVEQASAIRRTDQRRTGPQGHIPEPARTLAPGLGPEARGVAAPSAAAPAHDLAARGPAVFLQPLFTRRAGYSLHVAASLPERLRAATSGRAKGVLSATAWRRHVIVTRRQHSGNPVALPCPGRTRWTFYPASAAMVIR